VYVESRKIAEIESGTYEHMSGDEAQTGSDGYLGHSDGTEMVKLQFSTVTPAKGHAKDLRIIIMQKKDVQVGIQVDGKFEQFEGRLTSRTYNFDSKTGSCKGQFTFEGGKPEAT